MLGYICKYAPIEVFESMGVEMKRIDPQVSNFTQADMNWLDKVGCPIKMTSLEDGVTDFVQNYLSQPDPYL